MHGSGKRRRAGLLVVAGPIKNVSAPITQRVLVWDLPTRIFHWSLAVSFAGAFLTGDSERWRDIHVLLGRAEDLTRFYNIEAFVSNYTASRDGTRALFQVINFSQRSD